MLRPRFWVGDGGFGMLTGAGGRVEDEGTDDEFVFAFPCFNFGLDFPLLSISVGGGRTGSGLGGRWAGLFVLLISGILSLSSPLLSSFADASVSCISRKRISSRSSFFIAGEGVGSAEFGLVIR